MQEAVNPFANRRVAFIGKLGGMTLREASDLVRRLGGTPVNYGDSKADLLVIGAEESDPPAPENVEVLTETELWQRLGLLDDAPVRRLYTPMMLAQVLSVPVSTIRRWHKAGLIHPQQMVHRLPYFTFEEIAVARRLVELVENGASQDQIAATLKQLGRHWPGVSRPLADLAVQVEGRRLLVKRDGQLLEPNGQQRLAFAGEEATDKQPATLVLRPWQSQVASPTMEQLVALAEEHEESGDLAAAAEAYRAALAAGGLNAQLCFQLAECLYRLGELSAARERYSVAVELDEDFLEARLSLGCVLADLGQTELAIAALQGALALHADLADAHYHLARLLDSIGRTSEAQQHRQRYHELAPASPWIDQTG